MRFYKIKFKACNNKKDHQLQILRKILMNLIKVNLKKMKVLNPKMNLLLLINLDHKLQDFKMEWDN